MTANYPDLGTTEKIGGASAEERAIRLECLREARKQAIEPDNDYAETLYRARYNARFVLSGETPGLRLKPSTTDECGGDGDD